MATLTTGEPARMYALGKVARGGATRGGYTDGRIYIRYVGYDVGWGRTVPWVGTLPESVTITDVLDETPNTCQFTVNGSFGALQAEVIITLGSKNRLERLFAGYALTVHQQYAAGKLGNLQVVVAAVDYTWILGFLKVTKIYRHLSASAIAIDLIQTYAAGFTTRGIAPNLPTLDVITFTNEDLPQAMTRLARRIGAYWYVDYQKDIHLFFTETRNGDPVPITTAHRSAAHFVETSESTQALTRVYVEGRGTTILGNVAPGSESIPLESVNMFAVASDVFLKLSFQGSEGGAAFLSYTGVVPSAGGAVVGPGSSPSNPPVAHVLSGTGIESGTHGYALTWVTAAGETLPSTPLATVTHGPISPPPAAPTITRLSGNDEGTTQLKIGTTYEYACAYSAASSATDYSLVTLASPVTTYNPAPATGLPSGAPTAAPGAVAQSGGNIEAGSHGYCYTFLTAAGETLASPPAVVTHGITSPNTPVLKMLSGTTLGTTLLQVGQTYEFVLVYSGSPYQSYNTTSAVTAPSPPYTYTAVRQGAGSDSAQFPYFESQPPTHPTVTAVQLYYRVKGTTPYHLCDERQPTFDFYTGAPDLTLDAKLLGPPTLIYGSNGSTTLTLAAGVGTMTGRRLYRTTANSSVMRFHTTIGNIGTTTFVDTASDTTLGAAGLPASDTSGLGYVQFPYLAAQPSPDSAITFVLVLVRPVGGATWSVLSAYPNAQIVEYSGGGYVQGTLGAVMPGFNRTSLSAIAIGPASVTARKLYRTVAGGTALKLLTTVADNTTLAYTDAASDSTLGAAPPAVDTSGLDQPKGAVTIGATMIPVTSTAAFRAAGGWAIVGNGEQVVRYTGLSIAALTGIPATGTGAIHSAVSYNTSITAAAMLTGIPATGPRAITDPLTPGDEVYLVVQVDDPAAQSVLAAHLGGTGIREEWVQDRRLSIDEARARGRATIAMRPLEDRRITYTCRDLRTAAGKMVHVNLPVPTSVVGDFRIQRVTISGFRPHATQYPTFTVEASSQQFNFEDWLRRMRTVV